MLFLGFFVVAFVLCCLTDEVHKIRKILERNDK